MISIKKMMMLAVALGCLFVPLAMSGALGAQPDDVRATTQAAALSPDGDLDPAFGDNGIVTTDIGGRNDFIRDMALQPDGKIVAVGLTENAPYPNTNDHFAVIRYNSDGSLDTTFSDDGIVTTALSNTKASAYGVALQSDGKILVTGYSDSRLFTTVRYNSDGTLDTTFDNDGIVTTSINTLNYSYAVEVQSDGKILVGGTSGHSDFGFTLVRYNQDGTLDTTFSGDGIVTTLLDNATVDAIALQTDGKIIAAGSSHNGDNYDISLVRYNQDGSLDTTFDGDGKVTTDIRGSSDSIGDVVLQPDGKIVVAGGSYDGSYNDTALVRYNQDGSLDTTFDYDGKVITAVSSSGDSVGAMALQPDGQILVAGYAINGNYSDLTVLRYNRDGSLDGSFGNNGIAMTSISNRNEGTNAMALLSDGKIIAAGYSRNDSDNDFALVRYQNSNFTLVCPTGSRLHVKDDASGNESGTDWANAFTRLQDALYYARECDNITEIWVAAGIYYPDEGLRQVDNERSLSFHLSSGVAIYGGFNGTETERTERDWEKNVTVLSGDIDQNDNGKNQHGIISSNDDIQGSNAYHVVTGILIDNSAILDGFTINAGQANGSFPNNNGGGIYNDSGSPTLENLTISANSASRFGGGVYNWANSSPTLTNVTISANSASYNGGGMYNYDNSPTLTNVIFRANSAQDGGGMFNASYSSPTLTNVVISANSTTAGGGAIYNHNSSNPTLTNVTISANSAGSSGGGIYNNYSDPILTNVIIWNNQASGSTTSTSASIYNYPSSTPSYPNISYSLIANSGGSASWNSSIGINGGNNIDTNPLFAIEGAANATPPKGGYYYLAAGSPAFDVGDNSAIGAVATDVDGNARIQNGTVDLGAYEGEVICPTPTRLYVKQDATGSQSGADWANAYTNLQDALLYGRLCDNITEIWVAGGIYYPDEGFAETGNHPLSTFRLASGLAIYGGFAGNETELTERDWETNLTVLSGDIDKNDLNQIISDVSEIQGSNAYHVVTGSDTDNTAILDGFTIIGGQADGSTPHHSGGGIYNDSGSPILENLTIRANSASAVGGGMHNQSSSSPILTNVQISANFAGSAGGGIFNWTSSDPTLTNVIISANSASNNGGGMFNNSSNPSLINVTISANSASNGGGIYNNNSSNPTLTNVIIWNNQASGSTSSTSASIVNSSANTTISHSLIANSGGSTSWNSSIGTDGGNNIDSSPLFAVAGDPSVPLGGYYRVLIGSPVLDVGDNNAVNGIATDLLGDARIQNGTVDLGVYEGALVCPAGSRLHVKYDATGSESGVDWANAFTKLQEALLYGRICDNISEIWVAAGIYYPDEGAGQTANHRHSSFQLVNGLAIYGGFAGTESERTERNWETNLTVLSGDIDRNDKSLIIRSTDDIKGSNAYHVVTGSSTDNSAILDGFMINAGKADGSSTYNYGGGIYNDSGSPILENLTISANAAGNGGGLYNNSSHPTVTNSSFSQNSATYGAGLYNNSSNPTLTNLMINLNAASSSGGGIYNQGSTPTLSNVVISANSAGNGGGMYNNSSSNATLVNVTISANAALSSGGGIYNASSNPTLTNVIVWNNRASNSTISTSASIVNSSSSPTISYSLIANFGGGGTNLDDDPFFALEGDANTSPPTEGYYALSEGSVALDVGNNSAIGSISTDLAGNPRIVNDTIDLGAYEGAFSCPFITQLHVKHDATGNESGADWANAFTSLQEALSFSQYCPNIYEIWVAAGVYYPDLGGEQLNNDQNSTFQLRNELALYGGFAGTETQRSQRSFRANITVLSGDIDQNDSNKDVHGIISSPSDIQGNNAYHVVTSSGTNNSAILDGFTINAGHANGTEPNAFGAGIYNVGGSPILENLTISANQAETGAALYNSNSSQPALENVIIRQNLANGNGGGIFNESSDATLKNVLLSANWAYGSGGGIVNKSSQTTLINVTLSDNRANNQGGAIYNEQSSPTLTNAIIWNNQASDSTSSTSASIVNASNSSPTISTSLIANSGGSASWNSSIGSDGGNNIDANPLFITAGDPTTSPPTYGNYELQASSPAIDVGNNSAASGIENDLAGNPRIFNTTVDLGAYEFTIIPTATPTQTPTPTNTPTATPTEFPTLTPTPTSTPITPTATPPPSPTPGDGRSTRNMGTISITANTFTSLPSGETEASGDVWLGDYLRLSGDNDSVIFGNDTLTGTGTVILRQDYLSLFTGTFNAAGSTGMLTPAEDVAYILARIAGFTVSNDSLSISQINIANGDVTGESDVTFTPASANIKFPLPFTLSPGFNFSSQLEAFELAAAGAIWEIPAGATLSNDGIAADSATLVMPKNLGGASIDVTTVQISPTGISHEGADELALPDLPIGDGEILNLTNNQASFSYNNSLQDYQLNINTDLVLSLPDNDQSFNLTVSLGWGNGYSPQLEGTLNTMTLSVAGSTLNINALSLDQHGLSAETATLTLPEALGSTSVILSDISISDDGLDIGSGGFDLPQINIGDGSKVKLTGVSARIASKDGNYIISASGTLNLNLPNNQQNIPLSFIINSSGDLSGTVGEIQLDIATATLTMKDVTLSTSGLVVGNAVLEFPTSLGGTTATLSDVSISAHGLEIGGGGFTLPDIKIGDGETVKIKSPSAEFSSGVLRNAIIRETAAGYTITFRGILQVRLPQNNINIVMTGSINTNGEVNAVLNRLTLKVAQATLKLTDLTFDNDGLIAATGSLQLPPSLGGATGAVENIRINESGLSISGGGVDVPLGDLSWGGLNMTNVTGGFILSGRTYKVKLAGTIDITIPGSNTSATGEIIVDDRGNISGSVKGFSLGVAGLQLGVQGAKINGDTIEIAQAKLKVPPAWGGLESTIYNSKISTSGGLQIGGGRFKVPPIQAGSFRLGGLEAGLKRVGNGYEIVAAGNFAVPGMINPSGGLCSLVIKVTIFVSLRGETVLELSPPDDFVQQFAVTPEGEAVNDADYRAERVSHGENDFEMAFKRPLPREELDQLQAFAMQLREISVGLQGCPIPIGNTGFSFTAIQGTLTLSGGSTRIQVDVTIESDVKLATIPILRADASAYIQSNPLELGFDAAVHLFVFKAAQTSVRVNSSGFKATLSVDIFVARGQLSVRAWSAWNGFNLDASASMSVGVRKAAFLDKCFWILGCITLPPRDVWLGSANGSLNYHHPDLRLRGSISFLGKVEAGFEATYISGFFSFRLTNIDVHLLRLNSFHVQQANQARLNAIGRGLLSEDQVWEENGLKFYESSVIATTTTFANPTDAIFLLAHQPGAELGFTLLRPNGEVIDHQNGDLPDNMIYSEEVVYTVDPLAVSNRGPVEPPVGVYRADELATTRSATQQMAQLRFVQASPDAPLVDLYVDGTLVMSNTNPLSITERILLDAGSRLIEVVPAGGGAELMSVTLDAAEEKYYTLLAVDELAQITPLVLTDTDELPDYGQALLRFVHTGSDTPAVDVVVDNELLFSNIAFKEASDYLPLDAGDYSLELRETGTPNVLLTTPISLTGGTVGTVFALGTANNLEAVLNKDKVVREVVQRLYVVNRAEAGDWELQLSGSVTDTLYTTDVIFTILPPELDGVSVSSDPSPELTWQLTSSQPSTTISIYANDGDITDTHVVTNTEGVTETITVPIYTGTQIATDLSESSAAWINGTPQSHALDIRLLPSGTYNVWLEAEDGRNAPVRTYAPEPLVVDHSASWEDSWTANIQITPSYRGFDIAWDAHEHPDVDGYLVYLGTAPLSVTEVITVGNYLSTTLLTLDAGETYYVSIAAQDEESGALSISEEVTAVPEVASFNITTDATPITIQGGDEATASITLNTTLDRYPDVVGLYAGDLPEGIELTFASTIITPTIAGVSVSVNISTTETVVGGAHQLEVLAKGPGITETVEIPVNILEPRFSLELSQSSLTLSEEESASIVLNTNLTNGENDAVWVELADNPLGLQWDFDSDVISPSMSVTLTLSDTELVEHGQYEMTIYGEDGENTESATLTLNINKPTFDVTSPQLRVLAGEQATFDLNVAALNGWSDEIDLALSGIPAQSTVGLRTADNDPLSTNLSVTPPQNVSLVVSTTLNTPAGVYLLTIDGTHAEKQESFVLELEIVQPVIFEWGSHGATGFGVSDNNNSPLQTGDLIQLIWTGADGQINLPLPDGAPGGDDELLVTTSYQNGAAVRLLQNNDEGFIPLSALTLDPIADANGGEVYIRAWNANDVINAEYYGESETDILEHRSVFNAAAFETDTPLTALDATLALFEATSQKEEILITWQTKSEQNSLGFNLYRATEEDGEQVQINSDFIPSQAPGSGQGAAYQFADQAVEGGTTYYYWLEDIDTEGNTYRHGPISATANIPTALSLQEFQPHTDNSSILWLLMTMVAVLMVLAWREVWRREA